MLLTIKRLNRAPGGVSDKKRQNKKAEVTLIKDVQRKPPAIQTELDDIVVVPDVLW